MADIAPPAGHYGHHSTDSSIVGALSVTCEYYLPDVALMTRLTEHALSDLCPVPECGKAVSRMDNLKRHMKTHHSNIHSVLANLPYMRTPIKPLSYGLRTIHATPLICIFTFCFTTLHRMRVHQFSRLFHFPAVWPCSSRCVSHSLPVSNPALVTFDAILRAPIFC